ncbi:MAG: hypothetical protein M0Z66_16230 [Thermaerobacter sp.]|nr:hypothetical protein [Thermaerobacter sp.]
MPERRNLLQTAYPAVFFKLQHRLNEQELDISALTMTIQPSDHGDAACTLGVRPSNDSTDSFRSAFGELAFDVPASEAKSPGPKIADFSEQLILRYKEALAAVPR